MTIKNEKDAPAQQPAADRKRDKDPRLSVVKLRRVRRFEAARRPAVFIAIALVVIDGLVLYQGILSLAVLFCMTLFGLPRLILRPNARTRHERVGNLGIYACAVVAVLTLNEINLKISEDHAEEMVAAVEKYRSRHGEYPRSLEDLVPEFMPAIPVVRYTFPAAQFEYFRLGPDPVLAYTAAPPFTRPTYDFAQAKWSYRPGLRAF